MTEFPETRQSLLIHLDSARDRDGWAEFEQIYRPIVYRMARRHGLQVMLSVANSIARWQQQEGARFRHWLRRVTKNAIINALTRQPPDAAAGGTDVHETLAKQAANPAAEQMFELEFRREIYRRAAQIVRSDLKAETWEAFELTAIEGQTIEEVAHQMGKSVGCIYAARSRTMKRLQTEAALLQSRDNDH